MEMFGKSFGGFGASQPSQPGISALLQNFIGGQGVSSNVDTIGSSQPGSIAVDQPKLPIMPQNTMNNVFNDVTATPVDIAISPYNDFTTAPDPVPETTTTMPAPTIPAVPAVPTSPTVVKNQNVVVGDWSASKVSSPDNRNININQLNNVDAIPRPPPQASLFDQFASTAGKMPEPAYVIAGKLPAATGVTYNVNPTDVPHDVALHTAAEDFALNVISLLETELARGHHHPQAALAAVQASAAAAAAVATAPTTTAKHVVHSLSPYTVTESAPTNKQRNKPLASNNIHPHSPLDKHHGVSLPVPIIHSPVPSDHHGHSNRPVMHIVTELIEAITGTNVTLMNVDQFNHLLGAHPNNSNDTSGNVSGSDIQYQQPVYFADLLGGVGNQTTATTVNANTTSPPNVNEKTKSAITKSPDIKQTDAVTTVAEASTTATQFVTDATTPIPLASLSTATTEASGSTTMDPDAYADLLEAQADAAAAASDGGVTPSPESATTPPA